MPPDSADNAATLTYPHWNLSGGFMGNSTATRPTVRRVLARATLGAVGVTGVIGGGLLLALDNPNLSHEDALVTLGAIFAVAAALGWVLPRAMVATDAQILRWTIVVMTPLVAVGLYATLAVLGYVPAAPWSALG